ncbi:DUF500-domain-containing protein [Nadsonia fulvescens var. elongata DSM 6958]|uniref:DUF500-domain-containing protein n=1 Tax=Nadsonia fulvescens var. elongata DSM 6958 TaxID=857566 RepID=A0A1E3PJ72_9ASCO|nr:DUF500-domain-containing protein [Nadsonia fulvescens var. elongata DSM 6958]
MGINNPVPRSLGKEAKKAAAILASFIKPNQIFGADMVIPPEILASARGLAVITVLKAGFLFSGRAGSGVIVARLPDGSWSAPSAIVTAGAGVGGMIGAELTDFVFILNTDSAVKTFSRAGSITLGGNVSVAAGPLGRNAEAGGSLSTGGVAAVFSYSKTKGLYAGISLEGSVLIERREANRKFYGPNCTAKLILAGQVEPPAECDPLFRVLETRAFRGYRASEDFKFSDDEFYNDIPSFNSDSDSEYPRSDSYSRSPRNNNNRNHSSSSWSDNVYDQEFQRANFKSSYSDKPSRPSSAKPNFNNSRNGDFSYKPREAVALYSFEGEQDGDLGFHKGDVVDIVKRSDSKDDWWTGRIGVREGIFPANYVELM